jgi:hypothetical protein
MARNSLEMTCPSVVEKKEKRRQKWNRFVGGGVELVCYVCWRTGDKEEYIAL